MLQKKFIKDIKVLLKKKKEKSNNMVVKDQNLAEDEKKLVQYRKNTINWEKTPNYNYNKLFSIKKSVFF